MHIKAAQIQTVRIVHGVGILAVCLFFAGCSGNKVLLKQVDTLQERVDELETKYRVAASRFNEIERINQLSYAFQDRLEDLGLRQNMQESAIKKMAVRLNSNEVQAQQAQAMAPPQPRQIMVSTAGSPVQARTESAEPTPRISVGKDETVQEVYSRAYKFLQDERYVESDTLFRYVLATWPKDDLADNSLYWQAEIQYARKNWLDALKVFEQVQSRYPNGNKVPDSLLKVALCWEKLGDTLKSRQVAERLKEDYPWTPAAEKTAAILKPEAGGK